MLNNFCFHLCSKVVVYRRKLQSYFFDSSLSTLSCYFRVHRAGSQLKMSESQTKAGNQECLSKLSRSHSLSLDMLNKFCFHVYAEKSLFIAENCNGFFLTSSSSSAAPPYPLTLEFIELVPS